MARGMAVKNVTPGSKAAEPTRRGRGRSSTIRRLLTVAAFLPIAGRAPLYARLVWALLADARTPMARKAALAGAVGYILIGRDIVPDDIPILGSLDDLAVAAIALDVFFAGIDDETLEEKLAEAGISRAAYDEDVARIRRLLPGPVRRLAQRIPGMAASAGDMIKQTNVGPRLRAWMDREGSVA